MQTKRRLREKIIQLEARVSDLEDRLCPCESHDWKAVDYTYVSALGGYDTDTLVKYKCRRCGKIYEKIE